jgi:hypothetical protein
MCENLLTFGTDGSASAVTFSNHKRIIEDVSTDELYKVLRLRVRPKIILASNYEEAQEVIQNYKDYMLCLITDVKYKKDGVTDENAGIKLLEYTRKELPNLPTIIQSSDKHFERIAKQYHSQFIYKNSEKLYEHLQDFLTEYLGFGDFVFKDSKGNIIARAANMREFEKQLKKIPEDSLLFHASRDHFSMWLMARGEIRAASIIYHKKVSDFKDSKELREELLNLIKEHLVPESLTVKCQQRLNSDSRVMHFHQQKGNAQLRLGLRIGAYQHENVISPFCGTGPDFGTADNIVITVNHSSGPDRRQV